MLKIAPHESFGKVPPEGGVRQEGGRSGGKIEWKSSEVILILLTFQVYTWFKNILRVLKKSRKLCGKGNWITTKHRYKPLDILFTCS